MSTNLILVGAPGSGKTTVGRLLAKRLDVAFTDIDQLIEAEQGKPIGEIFADDGEPAFRTIEAETTRRVLDQPGVISLGGGAILAPETRTALKAHRVIWLQVGVPQASRRVGLNEARPLLLGNVRGTLIRLLAERAPLYAEVATITVATDERRPDEVVELILAELSRLEADDHERVDHDQS